MLFCCLHEGHIGQITPLPPNAHTQTREYTISHLDPKSFHVHSALLALPWPLFRRNQAMGWTGMLEIHLHLLYPSLI